MVEATRGYYFSNEYEGKVIEETKDIKKQTYLQSSSWIFT